ncbi:signal recognition particle-docking protein FtsY [Catenovulum sp. 2E275]|uniref:signal recognition particle-docking protein FtsY n=1 Tax=Catenovulum sp. 2E275 TaxID=2980497 RepID=UPI0021CE22F6|nr:signal recognition particle-docking protein FtsY [Catenovulum sp. 2E275]MCU4676601.1 signal recognition particle-docking protein FtsY [Catenovulum sp. 2E275]
MSKKKGLFSWFGRKDSAQNEQVDEQKNEAVQPPEPALKSETEQKAEKQEQNEQQNNVSQDESLELAEDIKNKAGELEVDVVEAQVETELATEPKADEPEASEPEISEVETNSAETQPEPQQKPGFFSRLKQSLTRTKASIGSGLFGLFKDKKIDDDLFEELETQLLMADLGIDTTTKIINSVTESAKRKELKNAEALYGLLKEKMRDILAEVDKPLELTPPNDGPLVILMVGVNGVGKTTTIGKLAKQYQQQGKSVMLAAGDTFRAAAVEQLQVWGQRNNIHVVAQHTGADSASVVYDAFASAKAKNVDILIADTAGRLQNKSHLMEELKKIVRVMKKIDPNAPHEIMLVIDSTTGQNAVSQTKLFDEAVGLTGISLTKLDGTAKGGVIFAVADQFKVPIRYIGVGEGIDDLRPFNADDFIEALFSTDEANE